jgi:hypothetical protein
MTSSSICSPESRARKAKSAIVSTCVDPPEGDSTVIAEGTTQGGSNGVIGEFKANLEFERRPNQRLGVVEAFEESASGSGEELHLDPVPIVFG